LLHTVRLKEYLKSESYIT